MKMAAKEAKNENAEKTSMDRWMKQVRCFRARHLGNTNHRGELPMPFIAECLPCTWRAD
jgi:hypothetical protein